MCEKELICVDDTKNVVSNVYTYEEKIIKKETINKTSLILTDQCNLKCKHCYNTNFYSKKESVLSFGDWKNVIDWAIDRGCVVFQITGGEPFCYPHLFDILDYLEMKNVLFGINSNGILIDKAIVERLSSYKKLYVVSLSIYGFFEETYQKLCGKSFNPERLIDTFISLKEKRIQAELKYIFTNLNYKDALKIRDFEEKYGININKNIAFIYPYLSGTSEEDWNLNKDQIWNLHRMGCVELPNNCNPCMECSLERCTVAFNGNISICEMLQGMPLGNLKKEPLDLVWTEERFEEIMKKYRKNKLPCEACEKKKYCTRCNGVSFLTTGNISGCGKQFKEFTEICEACTN